MGKCQRRGQKTTGQRPRTNDKNDNRYKCQGPRTKAQEPTDKGTRAKPTTNTPTTKEQRQRRLEGKETRRQEGDKATTPRDQEVTRSDDQPTKRLEVQPTKTRPRQQKKRTTYGHTIKRPIG